MIHSSDWKNLPDTARLWTYTASRDLTAQELNRASLAFDAFIEQWQAHGAPLQAGWCFEAGGRVALLAVDESAQSATGCSIDASVAFLKTLGEEFGNLDWFDRHIIMYRNPDWQAAALHSFWALRKAGVVGSETEVCDTTVRTLGEWRQAGIARFDQTWHQEMWR